MKRIIMLMIMSVFALPGFSQGTAVIEVIEPEQYQQQINKKDVQLVDVRTSQEYKEGHIKGARNIDFFAEDFVEQFQDLDKEKPVYIYCRSGNRSSKASKKLAEAGFKKIIDLEGGYKAWTGGPK